jgi:sensor histidine kinase regulating citrate/malate metabolism
VISIQFISLTTNYWKLTTLFTRERRNMLRVEALAMTLQTIDSGAIIIDTEGLVLQANRKGLGYLAVLADAGIGSYLSKLGDCYVWRLMGPPPMGKRGHEVVVGASAERRFEVATYPVEIHPQTEGWMFIVRDLTKMSDEGVSARSEQALSSAATPSPTST